MPKVKYKVVPGFTAYAVGQDGTVLSKMKRGIWKKMKVGLGRPDKRGIRRPTINLVSDIGKRRRKGWCIAALVLTVWKGPRPSPGHDACHFPDKDIRNNHISNLMWATRKENLSHRQIQRDSAMGETHYLAKLTEQKVLKARKLHAEEGKGITELARRFGVSVATMSEVLKRKTWKHI